MMKRAVRAEGAVASALLEQSGAILIIRGESVWALVKAEELLWWGLRAMRASGSVA